MQIIGYRFIRGYVQHVCVSADMGVCAHPTPINPSSIEMGVDGVHPTPCNPSNKPYRL